MVKILFVISLATLVVGCKDREMDKSSHADPKTVYGQSVKKAKDLSSGVSERDEKVAEQSRELADEQ